MAGLEVKSFAQPDEFQKLARFTKEEVVVGGVRIQWERTEAVHGRGRREERRPLMPEVAPPASSIPPDPASEQVAHGGWRR